MSTSAADEPVDALVGQTLPGGWHIDRHLAEGGMAQVYVATGPAGERAAVKVLHAHLMDKPDIAFRFRREGEIVDSIRSTFVPKVLGRGKDGRGRSFIAFELVDGRELSQWLEERVRLTPVVAVEIALQMCEALRAAHLAGIVHRDMKPENVLVAGPLERPTVKVLDFSISKDEDLAFTQQGHVIGTPCYMAVEQALGQPVTPLADIYSVGAILFDMLTGRPPYEADEPGRVLAALLSREPPALLSLHPSLPPSLAEIVERAMARDAKQRFQRIEWLIEALTAERERLERTDRVDTIPPPAPTPVHAPDQTPLHGFASVPPPPKRRLDVGVVVAVAVAFLLLAGAAALIFGRR
jgi:eukaryotic-like serine/threonine-protein kinase